MTISRRHLIRAAGTAVLIRGTAAAGEKSLEIAGREVEVQLVPVSECTFRLSVLPIVDGKPAVVPSDGSLIDRSWRAPVGDRILKLGAARVRVLPDRLTFVVETSSGDLVQRLRIDGENGAIYFSTGSSPLLGLGEGGAQFDRRGSTDRMRSGQGGYQLRTHGGRVPIPWLIGTGGWAMFIHEPFGTFDFTGSQSQFLPSGPETALPLDIFFVASHDPAKIMGEYARLTGHPEKPPLWSFGYQQSHRTLASREEILAEAKTFREKKLPSDALIYLGTGFCPSGWNTANGSFDWNRHVFPDPQVMIEEVQ